MRILALLLILVAGAALLPPARGLLPFRLEAAIWNWIGFGALAMAALVYFLAPKD